MHDSIIQTIPPHHCVTCGNQRFHKTEKKIQYYQALIHGEVVFVEVKRRRYRCTECGNKLDSFYGKKTHEIDIEQKGKSRLRKYERDWAYVPKSLFFASHQPLVSGIGRNLYRLVHGCLVSPIFL